MGFCLGELFAPQPDWIEDIFCGAVRDTCVVEEFVSAVGEGSKEEFVSSLVVASEVGAGGEDSESDVRVRKIDCVFVRVQTRRRCG